MTAREFKTGSIVIGAAGREKGLPFLVVGTTAEGLLLLSDGDTRKLAAPKKKKPMHVRYTPLRCGAVAEKLAAGKPVTDSEIRKALAEQGMNIREQTEEG